VIFEVIYNNLERREDYPNSPKVDNILAAGLRGRAYSSTHEFAMNRGYGKSEKSFLELKKH
jgi:hypothetical protein